MAKTISDEKMKLSLIIDSNQAQKELFELEKSTRALTEENKQLEITKKRLIRQGKESSEEFRDNARAIKENNVAIKSNKDRMKELQQEIGLTSLSMKQLTDKARILRLSLNNAVPGSAAYKQYQTELNAVTSRMDELRGRAVGARASINNLADGFNRYAAMGASVIAVFTGVVLSLQKMIDYNGKLSDAQANVMKNTRMSKKEVDELTKSFGLLQTRTSRIDLLKIAEEGGRIGIAKNEVGEFVKEMNKASVALGDSFTGGVGEVAEKLGKLKFLFKETKDLGVGEAYNAIGSAINELGADGVASERNIAEFATRVGSLPDALKPTIANALALGAAFEESGIDAEVSSRAYNIFLKQASTESAKFAQVMGITKGEVEALINKDPMEFFLQFSQGMKGLSSTDTAKILHELGISADGANKVIATAGDNIVRFRSVLENSNKAFVEANSLMAEYEIKNNTLGATIEKIQKKILGAFSSETLIKWLTSAVNGIASLIGVTTNSSESTSKWRNTLVFAAKVVAVLTAAIMTNVAWQKLVTLWTTRSTEATLLYNIGQKTRAFITGITTVATQAQAVAVAWATRNTIAQKEAQIALGLAMRTTPWGFILSAIAAIATAYVVFSKSVDKAEEVQKSLNEVEVETVKGIRKQIEQVDLLTKTIRDQKLPEETRQAALKKLNELIGDNNEALTLQNINTAEGTKLLKTYTDQLYATSRAKAIAAQMDKLEEERVNIETKSLGSEEFKGTNFLYHEEIKRFFTSADWNKRLNSITGEGDLEKLAKDLVNQQIKKGGFKPTATNTRAKQEQFILNNLKAEFQEYIDRKNEQLEIVNAKINALKPEYEKNEIENIIKTNEVINSDYVVPDGTTGDKTPKKYDDSYLEAERRAREEAYQALMQMEANKIALMEEGYAKELALEKFNSAKKIHEIQMANEAILTLQKQLDLDLAQAIKDGDTKKITSIKNQQSLLLERQKSNGNLIIQEEQLSATRVSTIQEKAADAEIKLEQENYERGKVIRETKHNEALAALGNNAKAREKLEKEFKQSELVEQEKHLTALIEKFNLIVGKGKFEGFDLSLLTPEQVQQFTDEAAKVGLTLAELIDKKNQLSGNEKAEALSGLGLGGNVDILGFTPEHWETFFQNLKNSENGIESVAFAVQALTNMYAQYASFLNANEQAQLERFTKVSDAKKTKLKRQLDSGYISQATYNKQVEKIDNDLAKKKADIDYKQAKRQRIIAAANIISSTAQALIGLWVKPGFPAAIPLMSIVGAMGALQLATVMATPLPAKGYEKGLYPDYVNVRREQDGKQYRPRYAGKLKSGLVTQNSLMVAEGNKPEMVIDNRAWSRISPEVQNALIREIRGVKGFEQGYYKNNVMYSGSTSTTSTPSSNSDALVEMVLVALNRNSDVMERIEQSGLEAYVNPKKMQNIKNLKDGFKEFDNLKNRAKK
jgi:TP901 family phage tail tape measure protein